MERMLTTQEERKVLTPSVGQSKRQGRKKRLWKEVWTAYHDLRKREKQALFQDGQTVKQNLIMTAETWIFLFNEYLMSTHSALGNRTLIMTAEVWVFLFSKYLLSTYSVLRNMTSVCFYQTDSCTTQHRYRQCGLSQIWNYHYFLLHKHIGYKKDAKPDLWFSLSVMFNSLRPHKLWHTRLPYPSPSPGVCSN